MIEAETGGIQLQACPSPPPRQRNLQKISGKQKAQTSAMGIAPASLTTTPDLRLSKNGFEDADDSSSDADDSLSMTQEQRQYYVGQFTRLCPSLDGRIGGQEAKRFLEMSRLPERELRAIWRIADSDRDGQLSLQEFCVAMHLVVLRRHRLPLPQTRRSRRDALLTTVKELKQTNHTLVRLNNELLAEIKEVEEQRTALELELQRTQ